MGGMETPAIKRYGYGFVQGAAAAAAEAETKIDMRYMYAGTYEESDEVRSTAASWYKDGTQVIFACGGAMGESVIKAAENNDGKVIGVDVDQSGLSETVITSAEKGLGKAVEMFLKATAEVAFREDRPLTIRPETTACLWKLKTQGSAASHRRITIRCLTVSRREA